MPNTIGYNKVGEYDCHLCKKCWKTTIPENTDLETVPCQYCTSNMERKVVVSLAGFTADSFLRCGGKDALSKWEEIKHRPPVGAKGF